MINYFVAMADSNRLFANISGNYRTPEIYITGLGYMERDAIEKLSEGYAGELEEIRETFSAWMDEETPEFAEEIARIDFPSDADGTGKAPEAIYYRDENGDVFMEWRLCYSRGYKGGDSRLIDLALSKIEYVKNNHPAALLAGAL